MLLSDRDRAGAFKNLFTATSAFRVTTTVELLGSGSATVTATILEPMRTATATTTAIATATTT